MVLHDSKWDRKAKRQYEKKHGILSDREKQQQQQLRDAVPDLPSNEWRFEGPEEPEQQEDDYDYSQLKAKQMELPKGKLYERNIFNSEYGQQSDSEDEESSETARRMLQEVSDADREKARVMREKRAKANQLMNLKKKFTATDADMDMVDDDAFFREIDGVDHKKEESKISAKKASSNAPTKSQQNFLDGLLN